MSTCFHCGDACTTDTIHFQDKAFCCNGCKTVYEILNENDLSYYYDLEQNPGTSPSRIEHKFDFLQNPEIANKLLDFNEDGIQVIELYIPSIHCSSCIWVLEHLGKLHPAIKAAQVNFPKKKVRITFSEENFGVYKLVRLLSNIGYEPYISLEDTTQKQRKVDRSLIYKLGIAGFAFGNIMFLSFPEYFEVNEFWLERFKHIFRWLMFAFSLPVVFYSAKDYFISAIKGLRSKILNIDVPIAIGITVLFIRSTFEIALDIGTGFFDSLTGLVFFLLLGKFFQQKTYAFLSFERDYKSYFPVAVTHLKGGREKQTPVSELQPGDRILIRNEELIPVDGILMKGDALIDYSFVTGEADPVAKVSGDKLFAGGRQQSGIIELEVIKSVEQSYLTQLWSNEVFQQKNTCRFETLTDGISKYFTVTILLIALAAGTFWFFYDPSMALNVFTAVLIIACPCAIALAAPFTLGNLLRIFGRHKLYLKNSSIIEQMAQLNTIVFDKTGTLTKAQKNVITYEGTALSEEEQKLLAGTLRASNHPLSRSLYELLKKNGISTLDEYSETVGHGIEGSYQNRHIRAGSHAFVSESFGNNDTLTNGSINRTTVHISTQDQYKGYYTFYNDYREGVEQLFSSLDPQYKLIVLSGDNDSEKEHLESLLPEQTRFYFNQKPENKLTFITSLQQQGKKVMMIGDGLNDAGALAQSDVGIALSENVNVFSPACDGILDADRFRQIPEFLSLSQKGVRVIKYAFLFSLLYNLIGLGFAITGYLKPVVAAILMPLSSISIVVFTTVFTYFLGKKLNSHPDC
ncbi:heavy metal translocating P-type ATPase metal-binding domain-containing protein [Aureisphaera galaxeae]|uniref:heavy metal translocating P-type ATPase n=1 Tax=Aureisphaera galaxeae TaxID=1538023 RepID=UPI002350C32D|nr:heavy metal translocating P-type ATPase metal-binding domain-containing protein [Aureisphaera galaxeae]MDC8005212.1 heavy metal translocating P-type ATPase metal-binding domain-containing protein [Aureisphaera galaxeae]